MGFSRLCSASRRRGWWCWLCRSYHLDIGVAGGLAVEPADADLAGEQRGELDAGPMADRQFPRRRPGHEPLDLGAGRLFENQGGEETGVEMEHRSPSSRASRSKAALGFRHAGIFALNSASGRRGSFGLNTADKWATGRP